MFGCLRFEGNYCLRNIENRIESNGIMSHNNGEPSCEILLAATLSKSSCLIARVSRECVSVSRSFHELILFSVISFGILRAEKEGSVTV
jgi:hypothetical protein